MYFTRTDGLLCALHFVSIITQFDGSDETNTSLGNLHSTSGCFEWIKPFLLCYRVVSFILCHLSGTKANYANVIRLVGIQFVWNLVGSLSHTHKHTNTQHPTKPTNEIKMHSMHLQTSPASQHHVPIFSKCIVNRIVIVLFVLLCTQFHISLDGYGYI